jgi:hypothetical protein
MKTARLAILLICAAIPRLHGEDGAAVRASAHVSAAISAGLPRFDQVAPEAPHRGEPFDGIALPPFKVEGIRIPKLSARALLSKTGMESLLRESYPGASYRGQEPTMNSRVPNYAALMHQDDLRLEQMADFQRVVDAMAKTGDPAGAKELEAVLQGAFLRSHDWRTEGMDKSVNHWRR